MQNLLNELYKRKKENLRKKDMVPPVLIELISLLERALAYAHTGNARVLTRKLGDVTFVSRGLLQHSLPVLNPMMFTLNMAVPGSEPVKILTSAWPCSNDHRRLPLMSSLRAVTLTWGEPAAAVSGHRWRDRANGATDGIMLCL